METQRSSYIAPIKYSFDIDGRGVKIEYYYNEEFSFFMTDGELEEWSNELINIADHMRYLYFKYKEGGGG